MKQNRLIPLSKQANIFSNSASRFNKRVWLFMLSIIIVASISITGIVLATSQPATTSLQSNIIDLPNLPAEMQSLSLISPVAPLKANVQTPIAAISSTNIPVEAVDTDTPTTIAANAHMIELAAIEQQAIATPEIVEHVAPVKKEIANIMPELTWKEITVKSGDNLSLIFPRVGLTARDTYNVAQLGKDVKPLLNLKPKQVLRFGFTDSQDPSSFQKLQLVLSQIKTLNVTKTTEGYQATMVTRDVETRQTHASGTIVNSLFGAGMTAELSDKIVMELAYIFGWDIDFALDLRQGDQFTLIYNEDYLDGNKIADGDILAAEFTNAGKTYRAVRYTDNRGASHYFTPEGNSMRKAFRRSPVHFSRISSKFNPNRKHPVLKTSRPHQGVDYAAVTGTPIVATGDGKVRFIGRKGGYGRTIILSHAGKYSTLYAHMSKFKKGLRAGQRVKQGQTIGYVGMSGLATGPHLHYEFRINGVHRNPLTVALPKADPLPKKYRSDFKLKSHALLAQLDNLSQTRLALNNP